MKLLQNLKGACGVLTVSALLSSCSSAVFPDIIEDDATDERIMSEDSSFVSHKGKKIELSMPKESNSLRADDKNAAYDEDKELDEAMDSSLVKEDKTESAGIAPVEKKDIKKAEPKDVKENVAANKEENVVEQAIFVEENIAPSVSYRMDTFYFANGSAVLDSKYNKQIRNIVQLAKSKKNAIVKVQGFASSRTRNTDAVTHKLANFKVSAARAASVAEALKRNGLPAAMIETEALSDSAPAYQEVMPEGERLNRRVEVYIAY